MPNPIWLKALNLLRGTSPEMAAFLGDENEPFGSEKDIPDAFKAVVGGIERDLTQSPIAQKGKEAAEVLFESIRQMPRTLSRDIIGRGLKATGTEDVAKKALSTGGNIIQSTGAGIGKAADAYGRNANFQFDPNTIGRMLATLFGGGAGEREEKEKREQMRTQFSRNKEIREQEQGRAQSELDDYIQQGELHQRDAEYEMEMEQFRAEDEARLMEKYPYATNYEHAQQLEVQENETQAAFRDRNERIRQVERRERIGDLHRMHEEHQKTMEGLAAEGADRADLDGITNRMNAQWAARRRGELKRIQRKTRNWARGVQGSGTHSEEEIRAITDRTWASANRRERERTRLPSDSSIQMALAGIEEKSREKRKLRATPPAPKISAGAATPSTV